MNVDVAYRLSKLRRDRGLSQEALSNKLGVSRQAVSKWERAESSPDTDNLIALAALYGMTLDDLLTGDPECSDDAAKVADEPAAETTDEQPADETTDSAADAAAADTTAETSGEPSGDHISFTDGIHVDSDGDHVHINWRDGVNVNDKNGAKVHVGWDGVHVEDPSSGDSVHTNDDGSVDVNGTHYDNWKDVHDSYANEKKPKSWLSRFPYPALALVGFLCMGILTGQWAHALAILFTVAIWGAGASLADCYVRGSGWEKKSEAAAGLVGALSIYAFLALGLLAGMWHPGWLCIVVGLGLAAVVKSMWPRN